MLQHHQESNPDDGEYWIISTFHFFLEMYAPAPPIMRAITKATEATVRIPRLNHTEAPARTINMVANPSNSCPIECLVISSIPPHIKFGIGIGLIRINAYQDNNQYLTETIPVHEGTYSTPIPLLNQSSIDSSPDSMQTRTPTSKWVWKKRMPSVLHLDDPPQQPQDRTPCFLFPVYLQSNPSL